MTEAREGLQRNYGRVQRTALISAAVGLAAGVVGLFFDQTAFFRSYFLGYMVWVSVTLGCFGVLMFHHLSGGRWGFVLRRLLEAGAWTLPVMALLFVPLVFGLPALYEWARPEAVAESSVIAHKRPYLNVPFFLVRTAVYFLLWSGIALLLTRWSRRQDETGDALLTLHQQRLGTVGLVIYLFTMTLAAVDWLMSLQADWFSHVFGLLFIAIQVLTAMALVVLLLLLLRDQPVFEDVLDLTTYDDLGNLLLAFVLFWMYIFFIQYLVIWSGNIPEEVTWYLDRTRGGWQWVLLAVVALTFVLPFIVLLLRGTLIHQPRMLLRGVVLILIGHLVTIYWLVAPAFSPQGLRLHWLDGAAVLGLGGVWVWLFVRYLQQVRLVPRYDPRLEDVIRHERRTGH